MYIIEVIPLTVLPPNVPQILSYFHDGNLPKGAIVKIPLHNRTVVAAVIDSQDLNERKLLLKKSVFQLKKISSVISATPQISDYQFKIALWLADTYVAPLGLAMKAVLPAFFGTKKY